MIRFLLIGCMFCVQTVWSQNYSKILYPGKNGKLVYKDYSGKGDIIPDFSYCGYMGGGVPIPSVPVKLTVEPDDFSEDDAPRIQQAIDQLAKEQPDKNGIRGAILLKKGKYNIKNTIKLNQSGIVLRGEGDGENGTLLIGTEPKVYSLIIIGAEANLKEKRSVKRRITDDYVPSGTSKITVDNIEGYNVGDRIIVERPSTKEWIHFIGMDKIADNWSSISGLSEKEIQKYEKTGQLSPDGKEYNSTVQWEPGKNASYLRTIAAIEGNKITLDIPLTNAFQKEYGGGYVYKYTYEGWISQCGVEHLRGVSEFNENIVDTHAYVGTYYADENHLNTFIFFTACENVWVCNLTSQYINNGYFMKKECRFVTVQDCNYLDPVAIIRGGRRYAYSFAGQMCLVQRCYSRNGRHDFVLGICMAGPNAFVDGKAEMCFAYSEPHLRWATGCLFDNCSLAGPAACFSMSNRGRFGSGHGWAGAQMVVWNCKSPLTVIMSPPTAQNFSIGNYGTINVTEDRWATPEQITDNIERLNKVSGNNFKYEGNSVVGDGYIESPQKYVSPQYLYYKQLLDRKGKTAVMDVTTPEQQKKIFQ